MLNYSTQGVKIHYTFNAYNILYHFMSGIYLFLNSVSFENTKRELIFLS